MHILIVSATLFEVNPFMEFLQQNFSRKEEFHFEKDGLKVSLLITGVGLTQTSYVLTKVLSMQKFDLLINAGIAGAFSRALKIGEVVHVISEEFGDLGVEEADGSFSSLFEIELLDKNQFPYSQGRMLNPIEEGAAFLPQVKGLSVNKVHGATPSIQAIQEKYDCEVESMEGAAFFFVCLMEQQNFLEIRAISNYVESRNRENWDIELAINNLNKILVDLTGTLVSPDSER